MYKRLSGINDNSRQRAVVNLNKAQSVGILFFANDKNLPQVKSLVQYLKDRKIETKALGYVNQKELGDKHKADLTFDYFCNKDCNWYGKPKGQVIQNFTRTPFNILIDLTLKERPALKFVAGMSFAKLKVGASNNVAADLIIDIKKQKTLEYYIEELKHYLNLINKHHGA